MREYRIGIIGGTGLYSIEGLEDIEHFETETPFGPPSGQLTGGILHDVPIVFLPRHGLHHKLIPSTINYRANIYALKALGVEWIIGASAVGSMKEHIHPRELVIPDQFFDRTNRKNTFFGDGIAVHIGFAQPVCPEMVDILYRAGDEMNLRIHKGGTYICIEGPAFSTKAESKIYRSWGCDVIGMTSVTEAKLCREAEICYATMNLVTDYDVWHETEDEVSVEMILQNLKLNVVHAKAIIKKIMSVLPESRENCDCGRALHNCIVTQADLIPPETKENLKIILKKYIDY